MSKLYKTVQGDMWDSIAYRQMGTTSHVGLLMRENRKHIHTFIFSSGVELIIPDVPEEPEDSALTLPWKKVTE